MPLPFSSFCSLLSELEYKKIRDPPFLPKDLEQHYNKIIVSWFNKHQHTIHAPDTNGVAILSALFPEKRTDRVYWLKETTLSTVLKRCLGLGTARMKLLDEWNVPGKGDLGSCVERAMRPTDDKTTPKAAAVTVDEIDDVLAELGNGRGEHGPNTQSMLTSIYRRLLSHEGKWMTRLILKDFRPVILPVNLVLRNFHFLLPDLLRVQDSFDAAMKMIKDGPLEVYPPRPDKDNEAALRLGAATHLRPEVNIKIGRAIFLKARSLKQCGEMAGNRVMSVQRKYDGEYCQVHIDLSRGGDCIKIFAKSGKDATQDRIGVHDAIKRALRIGQKNCHFKSRCILDGELLVYSERENSIMDFHKIRKYVSRSGAHIGTERDSPPRDDEHLMIMFHDLILVDEDFILMKPHKERYHRLLGIVKQFEGHAQIRESRIIDFSKPGSSTDLKLHFASAISKGWEGLVLKPDDDPYFSFKKLGLGYMSSAWVKLKKDLIAGLGDTADFAIIGGSFDGKEASMLSIKVLKWTSFHVGCLINKEEVCRFRAKPRFREVDVLLPPCVNKVLIERLNRLGYFQEVQYDRAEPNEYFDVKHDQKQLRRMTTLFKEPLVVDLMGAVFEKPSGVDYFMLRFARMQKIHEDRSFTDALSFDELQQLAYEARSVREEDQSQDEREWLLRLKASDPRILSRQTPSEDSYCTTARSSEPSPWRKNEKWSMSPPGPSTWSDLQTSPTSTKRNAVPMVRMDSGEMRPGEERLHSGEVVATTSAAAIPTPPSTSSQREKNNSSSKKRKAPSDAREADLNMPVPPRKRFAPTPKNALTARRNSVLAATATPLPASGANNGSFHDRAPAKFDWQAMKRKMSLPQIDEESTEGEPSDDDALEILSPAKRRMRILSSPSIGSSSNPIDLTDCEEPEAQDSLPSFVSTDYEGEPLSFDSNGTPQFYLEPKDLPLSGPRTKSPDLYPLEEVPSVLPLKPDSEKPISSPPRQNGIPAVTNLIGSSPRRVPFQPAKPTSHKGPTPEKQHEASTRIQSGEANRKGTNSSVLSPPRKMKSSSAGRRKKSDPSVRMIRESVKIFNDFLAKREEEEAVQDQLGADKTSVAEQILAIPPQSDGKSKNMTRPEVPGGTRNSPTQNIVISAEAPVRSTTTESPIALPYDSQTPFHSGIPAWYPHLWPAPANFLSTIPDPTVLYAICYTSVSLSPLNDTLRTEVAALLSSHFPKTSHTPRLTSFLTAPSCTFPHAPYHFHPLLKVILLDSQSSDVKKTFNRTASGVLEVMGAWKQHGRLLHAGKILFLDYRVVGYSARLVTDGVQDGQDEEMRASGPLEESKGKRELLGRLWRERFWLGCVAWDGGFEGEVAMRFARSECL